MDHLAIMRKSRGLTEKILRGEKTVETRRYKTPYAPYNQIHVGETIYFKDSGCPVTVKATVTKVEQFDHLTSAKTQEILKKYTHADLGTHDITPEIGAYTTDKTYCIIIHLSNPQAVQPFDIDKTGYGMMASWICVDDIRKIQK